MKTLRMLVLLVTALSLAAKDLPLVGNLPTLPPDWKLREEGKYGATTFRWHWIVLTNGQGDILSFASHRLEPGEERRLIHFSDTAHESFCDGFPMWTRKPKENDTDSVESIRNSIVMLDATRKLEALEFSLVSEGHRGTNRLAHGYAFFSGDAVVLVQHMSQKPITSEFVQNLAVSLASSPSGSQ